MTTAVTSIPVIGPIISLSMMGYGAVDGIYGYASGKELLTGRELSEEEKILKGLLGVLYVGMLSMTAYNGLVNLKEQRAANKKTVQTEKVVGPEKPQVLEGTKNGKNYSLDKSKSTGSQRYTKDVGVDIPNNSKNTTQYQLFKNELMKGDIIENSIPIIPASDLKDSRAVAALTKNGTSISDWAKMESTYSYDTSMGRGKIHYYKNLKTGEISNYDVKMKVPIPKDLRIREGMDYYFWIVDLNTEFIPKGVR